MTKYCIAHYSGFDDYSKLKDISSRNEDRLKEAKAYRIQLGGDNYHKEQCDMIPDVIDHTKHGIHSAPCYKKFTLILSGKKEEINRRASNRISSPTNKIMYPAECYFCKKIAKKSGGKIQKYPIKITTLMAEATVKNAAETKDPAMYSLIKDEDLIAKELKYHDKCYKEFTFGFSTSFKTEGSSSSQNNCSDINNTGDYEAVKSCINNKVLKGNRAVSMKELHDIYKLQVNDVRYRGKLKSRIIKDFGNKIEFLKPSHGQMPDIVINNEVFTTEINFDKHEECVITAAEYLREDILKFSEQLPELSWPPTVEELTAEERNPPPLVIKFLHHLLKNSQKHSVIRSDNVARLINSYASDLIHGVTRGKVITAKHFLLALGLHNLTGMRKVVEINNRLGHCISYNCTCDIETALAQKAQKIATMNTALIVKPLSESDVVLTYFWVDNFDVLVERQCGGGSVNTTHLVAFQEVSDKSVESIETPKITYTKKRLIESTPQHVTVPIVNQRKEPPLFSSIEPSLGDESNLSTKYFLWIWLRYQNQFDQILPNFPGWLLQHRINTNLQKTVLTFLPPIATKVTDYLTIETYMEYLQKLAANVHMPYVNITLDVGAALNAYKLLWNNQAKLSNVVLHLGDFHFMKENFQVLGQLMSDSGFEDIAFQSNLCTSGSLRGVISGTHYNRAWIVHTAMSEALERLLLARFLGEVTPTVPDSLVSLSAEPDIFTEESLENVQDFGRMFETFRERIRSGEYGKTAQYWLIYLDLMRVQHYAHTAVQENNFDLRLFAWQYFVPFYFALDKTNYARYGSFYVETMRQIEQRYPGLKHLLEEKGLSVLAQENHNVRTAIDQRGEQTINREAKTVGGIKMFAGNKSSVLKWCLNRADQAKNSKALSDMCGMTTDAGLYKPLRPSQILQTNERVLSVMKVFCEDYINPFGLEIEKDALINVSSGVPLPNDIADELLSISKVGNSRYELFKNERLVEPQAKCFHDPISRCKIKGFKHNKVKVSVAKNKVIKSLEVNRDILAKILSISVHSGKPIDFEKALQYPLSPLPLSLCNGDGTMRKTNKSDLLKILLQTRNETDQPEIVKEDTVYIVDLMAVIRTIREVPKTFEDLAFNIVKSFPSGYKRVDIVADTYLENSIKTSEREKRGESEKILIKSAKSKIPPEFSKFLSNGGNKSRMIELLFKVIENNRGKMLNVLKTNKIVLSTECSCRSLTLSTAEDMVSLITNQEEADTKVFLHCDQILKENTTNKAVIKSPSGDTDIIVLGVSLFPADQRVFIDNGTGQNRQMLWLGNFDLSTSRQNALLGFHAFTGNDYNASFFRKGKNACWKNLVKHSKFEDTFSALGNHHELENSLILQLEEYVCYLYGYRERSIDSVRFKMFDRKRTRENKIPDLSTFPPCCQVLEYHSRRSNAIAYIWKHSLSSNVDYPNIIEYGWEINGDIHWIDECFPEQIEDILLDDTLDLSDDEYIGSDVDSENDLEEEF